MVVTRVNDDGLQARLLVRRAERFTLDLTLDIEPGETLAVLGPNGAGKSTAVAAISGLLALDGGHLRLGGQVLDDPTRSVFVPPEKRRMGVVFQRYVLFEHLSILENVAFGSRSKGIDKRAARAAAHVWLDAFDLGEVAAARPADLSGGQAQRVAIARALACDPALLLLDEPMAALDIGTRNQTRRLLSAHLGQFPGPRLLITHDPTDAFLLADRICVIEAGRLVQMGSTDDLRRRPATAYVAAFAGTNLLTGISRHGIVALDGLGSTLQASDTHTEGAVLLTVHPSAIALHATEPHGSPRNAWESVVVSVEALGEITRVVLGDPIPLLVDVTPASIRELKIAPGERIWASVKATELSVSAT